jgi:Zn-dependent peptidase ImmA (M78 family)
MIAIFPKIAGCAASGDIERLAVLVRDYYAGDEKFAPQLDLAGLTQRAGIVLSSQQIDGMGAILVTDQRGTFQVHVVLHQDLVQKEERDFLLAHLLGHFFIDLQPLIARGDTKINGIKEFQSPLERFARGGTKAERADASADQFAAALLLPRGMLKRAHEKIQDLTRIAGFFGTTPEVIRRRLAQLGTPMESTQEPANFFVAEAELARKGGVASQNATPEPKEEKIETGEAQASGSKMDRIRKLAMALEQNRRSTKDQR